MLIPSGKGIFERKPLRNFRGGKERVGQRMENLLSEFKKRYGEDGEIRVFRAPGRVNLIGEHTDYNGGFVFPAAIGYSSTVAVRRTSSGKIRIGACDLPDRVELSLDALNSYRNLDWGNYQAGVAWALARAGFSVASCDVLYQDTVPFGAGLSSSAAIEVVFALMLATFSNEDRGISEPVNLIEMAKLSQIAENEYCGVSCGIMDQFASAMGKKDHAIFLDCRDLSYSYVPLDLSGFRIVIANTNKKRSLAESKYNERCEECSSALSDLKKVYPEIGCLRDVTAEMFEAAKNAISDPVCRKRAAHVVYECDRVLRSVESLSAGNLSAFGRLMDQSHDSLRDLYEVTGLHLDTMVSLSRKADGCIGSRMTGAGFGGCAVSLVAEDSVDDFIRGVSEAYTGQTGLVPSFYVTDAADGAREINPSLAE